MISQHPDTRPDEARRVVAGQPVRRRDVVAFADGLPGFERCRSFVLLSSPDIAPIQQLESVSGPEARFLAIDPRLVLPDYRCQLSGADRLRVGADDESVLLWLALLVVEEDGTLAVNLRAPIVINPATMRGQQVMPYQCVYPLRHVVTDLA